MVGEPGHEAGDVAPDDADNSPSTGHHDKAGKALEAVSDGDVLLLYLDIGLKHVVEHHSHSIVEQGLAKDNNVEYFVHVDLLKDGEHSDRINGGDERGEEQGLEDSWSVVLPKESGLSNSPEGNPDSEHVEDGADDGHGEDGAQVVEEEPVGHEVARVQDDRRQHEEEEDIGGEGGGRVL